MKVTPEETFGFFPQGLFRFCIQFPFGPRILEPKKKSREGNVGREGKRKTPKRPDIRFELELSREKEGWLMRVSMKKKIKLPK